MVPFVFTLPCGRCHENIHIRMVNQSPYELHANYVGHTRGWKTSYALMETMTDTCLALQARPHQRYWGKRRETRDLRKTCAPMGFVVGSSQSCPSTTQWIWCWCKGWINQRSYFMVIIELNEILNYLRLVGQSQRARCLHCLRYLVSHTLFAKG